MKPSINRFLAASITSVFALSSGAFGAARVWTSSNAANTLWTAANVWDGPATWVSGDSATFNNSAIVNLGSATSQTGITISSGNTLTLNATADLKITGSGTITGNLIKTGSNLRLSHSGGFNGTLQVSGGSVILGSTNTDATGQTSNQTKVIVDSGASLILGSAYNAGTATIGELSGAGIVRTDWADGGTNANRTLKVDQSTNSTFSGTFLQGNSGRTIGLEKTGSGVLTISNNAALSVPQGGVTVNGGTLKITGSTGTANPFSDTGKLVLGTGAVFEAANTTSGIPTGIAKVIEGGGTFLRNGSGNLVISGTGNSGFSGTWKATSGTLGFLSESAMGGSGGVTLDGGGLFMNANGAGISNGKTIKLGDAGGYFDGSTAWTQTWSATISGTGGFTKRSGMLLILDGTNNYEGVTTVQTGALRVNGTNSGTGAVNVSSGATLGGTGSIAGAVNVTGTLAPGASIESLGTGNLAFYAGSTLAYELNSTALNGDLLDSAGTLDIASGTILTLTDLAAGTLANGSKLTLISYFGGWVNTELFTYLGSTLADDSVITLGTNQWRFNYNDTSGGSNFTADQTGATGFVTMTVVPEPAAALLGGLGFLILLRRRRNGMRA